MSQANQCESIEGFSLVIAHCKNVYIKSKYFLFCLVFSDSDTEREPRKTFTELTQVAGTFLFLFLFWGLLRNFLRYCLELSISKTPETENVETPTTTIRPKTPCKF